MVEYLEKDIDTAIAGANKLYDTFDHLPEEAQLVIANMVFNMGYGG